MEVKKPCMTLARCVKLRMGDFLLRAELFLVVPNLGSTNQRTALLGGHPCHRGREQSREIPLRDGNVLEPEGP